MGQADWSSVVSKVHTNEDEIRRPQALSPNFHIRSHHRA